MEVSFCKVRYNGSVSLFTITLLVHGVTFYSCLLYTKTKKKITAVLVQRLEMMKSLNIHKKFNCKCRCYLPTMDMSLLSEKLGKKTLCQSLYIASNY